MILVYLENADEKLPKGALCTITAALQMKAHHGYGKVVGVVIGGKGVAPAAAEGAKYGLDEIVYLEGGEFENYLATPYCEALVQIAEELSATAVVGLASTRGKDLFPRVAQRLSAGQASDIIAVLPNKQFTRPMYAGNILADVEITTSRSVVTVRSTGFDPAPASSTSAPVRALTLSASATGGATFVSFDTVKSERPELSEAEIVVSGGRAMKSAENFQQLILPLADALGAAVGASRAAVDSGYAPNDWQVGQTGKVVAPSLYVAVGISGAIQHLAGMKDSKVIVAINKDAEAPIFEVADFGLVADLYEAVPQLTEAVKAVK